MSDENLDTGQCDFGWRRARYLRNLTGVWPIEQSKGRLENREREHHGNPGRTLPHGVCDNHTAFDGAASVLSFREASQRPRITASGIQRYQRRNHDARPQGLDLQRDIWGRR